MLAVTVALPEPIPRQCVSDVAGLTSASGQPARNTVLLRAAGQTVVAPAQRSAACAPLAVRCRSVVATSTDRDLTILVTGGIRGSPVTSGSDQLLNVALMSFAFVRCCCTLPVVFSSAARTSVSVVFFDAS